MEAESKRSSKLKAEGSKSKICRFLNGSKFAMMVKIVWIIYDLRLFEERFRSLTVLILFVLLSSIIHLPSSFLFSPRPSRPLLCLRPIFALSFQPSASIPFQL